MLKRRYLHSFAVSDLREKMVFIGGPRQVGKTTLANQIGKADFKKFTYLNWDSREDRKKIIEGVFEADSELLIFDEVPANTNSGKTISKASTTKTRRNFPCSRREAQGSIYTGVAAIR